MVILECVSKLIKKTILNFSVAGKYAKKDVDVKIKLEPHLKVAGDDFVIDMTTNKVYFYCTSSNSFVNVCEDVTVPNAHIKKAMKEAGVTNPVFLENYESAYKIMGAQFEMYKLEKGISLPYSESIFLYYVKKVNGMSGLSQLRNTGYASIYTDESFDDYSRNNYVRGY